MKLFAPELWVLAGCLILFIVSLCNVNNRTAKVWVGLIAIVNIVVNAPVDET